MNSMELLMHVCNCFPKDPFSHSVACSNKILKRLKMLKASSGYCYRSCLCLAFIYQGCHGYSLTYYIMNTSGCPSVIYHFLC